MLQFDLQFYEELTVAWVRTVKFISGAFFWPTGQLVYIFSVWYMVSEWFVMFIHRGTKSRQGMVLYVQEEMYY